LIIIPSCPGDVAKSTSLGGSPFGRIDAKEREKKRLWLIYRFFDMAFFAALLPKCAKTSVGHRGKHEFLRT